MSWLRTRREARAAAGRDADEWFAIGASTAPIEPDRARAAIAHLYRLVDAPPPREFVWLPSPREFSRAARACSGRLGRPLGDVIELSREALKRDVGRAMELAVEDFLAALHHSVTSGLGGLIARELASDPHRDRWHGRLWGQCEAPWVAAYHRCRDRHGTALAPAVSARLDAWADVTRHSGWWEPYGGVCLVADRPIHIEWERDRDPPSPHCIDGPAIVFRDGWRIYAIRGIRVDRRVVEEPDAITLGEIQAERNVELRRILIDRYGCERFLADCDARVVDEDRFGVLYTCEVGWEEPLAMVKVINSTPEPDGSFKVYFLRVPPHSRTAREAVAWTFGLAAHEYDPQIET